MIRLRACLSVLAVLLLALAAVPPGRAGSPARSFFVVPIDAIGFERLEALKATPGVEWWIENDGELLLAGGPRLAASVSTRKDARSVRFEAGRGELWIVYRHTVEEIEAVGARTLMYADGFGVVQATRAQAERLTAPHEGEEGCRGHSALVPFAPNTVIGRQAANMPTTTKAKYALIPMPGAIAIG